MSNPTVSTVFAMPDPGENPLNLAQLFTLANKLVSSTIPDPTFNTYIIQAGTPGVDQQGKVWIELDTAGRPLAIKTFYNGDWRRVYNGMLGQISMYNGNPTKDFIMTGTNFGRGIVGGNYDGWALCNGKNGTPDLSDHFIVGAHMDNADGHDGYDVSKGGWVSFVDGKEMKSSGGDKDITLSEQYVPRPYRPPITVDLWSADGNARSASGQLWGMNTAQDPNSVVGNVKVLPVDPGAPLLGDTIDPTPILPPFIALGFIQFLGYT